MAELMTEIVGGEPYEYYPLGEYVVRAPGVCGGRPTFKYLSFAQSNGHAGIGQQDAECRREAVG